MKELTQQLLQQSGVIYENALSCSNGDKEIALKRIYYAVCEVAKSLINKGIERFSCQIVCQKISIKNSIKFRRLKVCFLTVLG